MTKWAVYRGKVGLYALEYIDTLEGCKDLLGGRYVKQENLPIVVNRAGGRHSFYPVEDNFVEIIEVEDDKEPLTREQCFPKNSPDFKYGWISPEGDTYNTGFEGHYSAAEMIVEEIAERKYCYAPERFLEENGWIKISIPAPYTSENREKTWIYSEGLRMTKKQADTLVDLGYSSDETFQYLIEENEGRW